MSASKRNRDSIMSDLKTLLRSKGYIYALCLLFFDEFHVVIDQIHKPSPARQLGMNEALFVVGLLAQNEIDLSLPDSPSMLMKLKQQTKELLSELHSTYHTPFVSAIEAFGVKDSKAPDQKVLFGRAEMLVEPIHYSGTGAYDFQLIRLIRQRYKFDLDWLLQNRGYSPESAAELFWCVKGRLDEKSKRVNLFVRQISSEQRMAIETAHPKNEVDEFFNSSELLQYVELFEFGQIAEKDLITIRKRGFENFCKNLLDLSIINREDVAEVPGGNILLELFSCVPSTSTNINFDSIGCYNQCRSHPFLRLGSDRFFLPITFFLAEALYESPYYWMSEDKGYSNQFAKHRGDASEDLISEFLVRAFGADRVRSSVKIHTLKRHTETDIDVLCILGSKALCVQVKSKKLTVASRLGDDENLQKDFQAGVQGAFDQGKRSRKSILDGNARFIDRSGRNVIGLENVDEVFIMVVTTENYPSLAYQSRTRLKREKDDPFPLVLTVFDLEILVHYLKDPYEFLYYVRQRVVLADKILADEEPVILTYHLRSKLWKDPDADLLCLDAGLAEILSQDYTTKNLGIKIDPKNNPLASRWKDDEFDQFVALLATHKHPKITDVVFYLLDMSGDLRKGFLRLFSEIKAKSERDGEMHSFSIPPDIRYSPHLGFTFMSIRRDDLIGPEKRLGIHIELSKYKHKGDIWVGFCSCLGSNSPFDLLAVIERPWRFDELLQELAAQLRGTVKKMNPSEDK